MKPTVVGIMGSAGHEDALVFGDRYALQLFTNASEALEFLDSGSAPAHIAFVAVHPTAISDDGAIAGEIRKRFPRLPVLMLLPDRFDEPGVQPLSTEFEEDEAPIVSGRNGDFIDNGKAAYVHSAWGNRIRSLLPQVAGSDAPVLLQGETGAGKEVVARWLHEQSRRAHKPFLKVNCAALPSELVESELFGYERGAFTGAVQNKPGKFELAGGGTVFLDEIGDMDIRLQAKLLQFLQDQTFDRLGGKRTVKVNVRVIAATHCDLESAVLAGRFRRDLYYRINVITICVPALRDRRDEILSLFEHLLRRHAPAGAHIPKLTNNLKQALLTYDWPGNVRELENVARRLLIVGDPQLVEHDLRLAWTRRHERPAGQIAPVHREHDTLTPPLGASPLGQLADLTRETEASSILAALDASRWNRRAAAALLGISYKSLLYRMHKHGLNGKPMSSSKLSAEQHREALNTSNSIELATIPDRGDEVPKLRNTNSARSAG
jgi:DNA-binding NtrC family response regulator